MWKHGFLGYDASLMLDVVVTALVLIVPVLVLSIWLVKFRHRYALHKKLQLTIAAVLLLAVAAFEIDMQWVHGGWENVVNKNPDAPRMTTEELGFVENVLLVHLVFAISTPVIWTITLVLALRRMPRPPGPCAHSRVHQKLGWISAIDLVLTSVTGLVFYYVAFIR